MNKSFWKIGFVSIVLFSFTIVFFILPPTAFFPNTSITLAGWNTAGIAILMSVLWATEILPIAVTSLIPILTFPALGLMSFAETAIFYSNPLVFLYGGGFLLAIAMEKWNLHNRFALGVLGFFGSSPKQISLGFLVATASLSMWASNTATTLLLLPIGISVIQILKEHMNFETSKENFTKGLMLTIAYSASIGGMGTLIGSPPNALVSGYINETLSIAFTFWDWMKLAIPIMIILLFSLFLVLHFFLFPVRERVSLPIHILQDKRKELGLFFWEEKAISCVFVFTAFFWITLSYWKKFFPFLTDAGVAILGAFVLFCLPGQRPVPNPKYKKLSLGSTKPPRILAWEDAKELPWDIILLFGGGLSLAQAMEKSQLSLWIGKAFEGLQGSSLLVAYLAIAFCILVFTNLASNLATVATFLPIVSGVAKSIDAPVFPFLLITGLVSSAAFVLPVGTPPNAIVYSTRELKMKDMMVSGFFLSLVAVPVISLWVFFYYSGD